MDFCKNMLSEKNSQKLLEHSKKSVTDPTKTTSKRIIEITADATSNLISNKSPIKLQIINHIII